LKRFCVERFNLSKEKALLLIIDIQERLAAAMKMKASVTTNCLHLLEAARLLSIPVMLTEQYPKGLGPTLKEIREAVPGLEPFEKTAFDCCKEQGFQEKVAAYERRTVIIAGMEAHICVLQTALGLMREGYGVHVVMDAVCSRRKDDFKAALDTMRDAGAVVSTTETVLFQLLERAGTEPFKIISKRIK
jgi:nicotinamidase-related amidase